MVNIIIKTDERINAEKQIINSFGTTPDSAGTLHRECAAEINAAMDKIKKLAGIRQEV